MTEKNFFEKTLEKKVKGAENLPYSISLETPKNPFMSRYDWKSEAKLTYDWKKDFPYSAPEDKTTVTSFKRYIAALVLKKYSSP